MALATVLDVVDRLARGLTTTEADRSVGLLDEASDLVRAFVGWLDDADVPTPVPGPVTRVTSRMVARVLEKDAQGAATTDRGVTQLTQTFGPFAEQRTLEPGSSSGAPWMTKTDEKTLAPYRAGGGLAALGFVSNQTGRYRREA